MALPLMPHEKAHMETHRHTHRSEGRPLSSNMHIIFTCVGGIKALVCHLKNVCHVFSWLDTIILFSTCSHLLEAPGTLRSTAETLCTRSDTSRKAHGVTCRKRDMGNIEGSKKKKKNNKKDSQPKMKKEWDEEKYLISI